eukprot:3496598-Rhodomonas_salina.1
MMSTASGFRAGTCFVPSYLQRSSPLTALSNKKPLASGPKFLPSTRFPVSAPPLLFLGPRRCRSLTKDSLLAPRLTPFHLSHSRRSLSDDLGRR